MRLQLATMALSLAILTRQIQNRSVTAFQVGSSFHLRSFTTSSSSSSSTTTTTSSGFRSSLNLSAVEQVTNGAVNDTNDNDFSNLFPQKGKNILECPPRMRFAPSPTGR